MNQIGEKAVRFIVRFGKDRDAHEKEWGKQQHIEIVHTQIYATTSAGSCLLLASLELVHLFTQEGVGFQQLSHIFLQDIGALVGTLGIRKGKGKGMMFTHVEIFLPFFSSHTHTHSLFLFFSEEE